MWLLTENHSIVDKNYKLYRNNLPQIEIWRFTKKKASEDPNGWNERRKTKESQALQHEENAKYNTHSQSDEAGWNLGSLFHVCLLGTYL